MKRNRFYIPAEMRILPLPETDLLTESAGALEESDQGNDVVIYW